MFPDFLCIGVQKSGTEWLYMNLREHPDIWLPPVKEIHYFDYYMNHPFNLFFGRRWRKQMVMRIRLGKNRDKNGLLWDLNFFMRPHNVKWYKSIFEPGKDKKTGDITPAYSTLKFDQVANVYRLMPDTKIILLLRNPIDRAWSQMKMYSRKGIIDINNEKKVLNKIRAAGQILRGDYLHILENWQSFYPKEQLFIGFYDEISQYPENFLLKLYKFLGIGSTPEFIPEIARRKFHVGKKIPVQPGIAFVLANMYYDDIVELNRRFGGYTEAWLDYAKRLLNTETMFIP